MFLKALRVYNAKLNTYLPVWHWRVVSFSNKKPLYNTLSAVESKNMQGPSCSRGGIELALHAGCFRCGKGDGVFRLQEDILFDNNDHI